MPYPEGAPGVAHSFGFEIDSVMCKSIQEISGLKAEHDVIQYNENTTDGKYVIHKLLGRRKVNDLTIKRGITGDDAFEKWLQKCQDGQTKEAVTNASVVAYDTEGKPVKRWNLVNAFVKSIDHGTMKAGDTNALMQTIVISYEELKFEVA
jgi:phage tail-like protein